MTPEEIYRALVVQWLDQHGLEGEIRIIRKQTEEKHENGGSD